ncbi:DUF2382 domain-containing protein [Kineococcus aurantiacus]|uniref:Uncharacterized protein (TIGR02271 family) n=1 Tax=Kineococcus aurantiacus TaxID=37633 RepID=A0A7Y9AUE7_9ACTN|nr:PRC and DUF2382 domain-containing protein [Kineococcus aurantiacus]NYD20520.1 uncharacterized protein (TIGR02271 family) [Kineococcus aurantiacus]
MAHHFTPDNLFGATVTGNDGDKIGKVEDVYLDNDSGQPEWVSVKTGLFGSNLSLIPLAEASHSGDTLTVPFTKAKVKDAPHHDPGHELSESDEAELYRYYGVSGYSSYDQTSTTTTGTTGTTTGTTGVGTGVGTDAEYDTTRGADHEATNADYDTTRGAGHDTSGPNTDDAMTRSREELRVGTETREAGRARLRKYITSENVTRTVPVSHEEVRVTREPITEANRGAALSGGDLTEEEHEVVLTEERAVAAKETVPVERVRLDTETVQGEETVQAEVREEHIDLDADQGITHGERGTRGTDRS